MAKFIIECQNCGKYMEASTSLFAKKKIDCTCGHTINVRAEKMTSRLCAHCGNTVVFDQSKGDKALCPVCKEPINTSDSVANNVEFSCPTCSCRLSADKSASTYTCPLCDTVVDVQAQAAKERVREQGLASVIKYEGDNQTLVWKHPIEDFNLGSQLIVHESQEAVFYSDGQALDLFGPGRHTLTTENIPVLSKVFKFPSNAETIFHSEVYFINQTVQMGIKWGTDSKVRLFDPTTGLHVELGACGQFSIKVCDSRKLLVKLVGTANTFTHEDIIDGNIGMKPAISKFKAMIMTKVKSNLAKVIKENSISILEIDEQLEVISEKLRQEISPALEEYGLTMPEFYVTGILTPDDDPNFRRLKQQHADMYLKVREEQILKAEAEASAERQTVEAQTAARMKIIGAQGDAEASRIRFAAEAEEMRLKGFTYQQETARKVGMGAVENMGGTAGSGLGDIAGLGIALGAMGGVMNMTKDALDPYTTPSVSAPSDTWDCTCGSKGVVGNFCNNCGGRKPSPADTWDCTCGNKGVVGNFCNICGARKPASADTWDCPCGNRNVVGNFCNICGARKPDAPETWDCDCGNKGIIGGFCNNCGKKKGE